MLLRGRGARSGAQVRGRRGRRSIPAAFSAAYAPNLAGNAGFARRPPAAAALRPGHHGRRSASRPSSSTSRRRSRSRSALVLLGLAGPRVSPVAWLFRLIARPPRELEPAAPVRFSQALAAVFLTASVALLCTRAPRPPGGSSPASWPRWRWCRRSPGCASAARSTGCCWPARSRGRERRARRPGPHAATGPGWSCSPRPAARAASRSPARWSARRAGAAVVRVSLARPPPGRRAAGAQRARGAGRVGGDGRVRAARAGRLAPADLDGVLAALS